MFTPSYITLMNENNHLYDCIVLGLGPAGISASLYLKRYGDDVIAIGLDGGSLKEAHVVDNFYGLFHHRGEDILKLGYEQAIALNIPLKFEEVVDIEILNHVVVKTNKDIYHGKKLFLALGRNRRRPNIKNLRNFEGKGISYCATCDGFLYRNRRVAILGEGGELMKEEYDVLKNFTRDLFVLTNGVKIDDFNAIDKEISSIEGKDKIEKIVFKDNSTLEIDALFIASGVLDTFKSAKKIGLALDELEQIKINERHQTNVPFIFAGGDMVAGMKQIAKAVDDGMKAAFYIHQDLKNSV